MLSSSISPEATADHIQKMGRVADLLDFSITAPGPAVTLSSWLDPREINWPILFTALFMAGVAVFFSLRVNQLQPVSWPHNSSVLPEGPRGIGGWLIPVGIGVTITPLLMIATLGAVQFYEKVTAPELKQMVDYLAGLKGAQ